MEAKSKNEETWMNLVQNKNEDTRMNLVQSKDEETWMNLVQNKNAETRVNLVQNKGKDVFGPHDIAQPRQVQPEGQAAGQLRVRHSYYARLPKGEEEERIDISGTTMDRNIIFNLEARSPPSASRSRN